MGVCFPAVLHCNCNRCNIPRNCRGKIRDKLQNRKRRISSAVKHVLQRHFALGLLSYRSRVAHSITRICTPGYQSHPEVLLTLANSFSSETKALLCRSYAAVWNESPTILPNVLRVFLQALPAILYLQDENYGRTGLDLNRVGRADVCWAKMKQPRFLFPESTGSTSKSNLFNPTMTQALSPECHALPLGAMKLWTNLQIEKKNESPA